MSFITKYRIVWLAIVLVLGVSLDQISKVLVQKNLTQKINGIYYPIKKVEVIPNFFNIIYKENAAAAFSITESIPLWIRKPLLILISITASLFFLIWYLRMQSKDALLLLSFSFILAGALGNLIDRIRLGYVIDFIDIYLGFLNLPHLHWPTYNIADSLIVIGALGVLIRSIWPLKE